jgi:hypothetical protein
VASTTSWSKVTTPAASTVPTRDWLGRSVASSTSEIREDFSVPTMVAIADPALDPHAHVVQGHPVTEGVGDAGHLHDGTGVRRPLRRASGFGRRRRPRRPGIEVADGVGARVGRMAA